ncbi:hypothetical protein [Bradyrhizobium sp. CCBAU 051011]|uniref:hypothetical protein n=1 Tax=Bradyrhizobium sp. CCBAU 051011 TaxID=858422 RepID=UPI00137B2FC9|nr:hypothetical protein [Bradyrhizobium sp. CCBAU 051011]
MTTVVALDVFSGNSNPSWQLTAAQEKELDDRIRASSTFTHSRPSGVVGGLGYRGFHIAQHVESLTGPKRLFVHEGILDRGLGLANYVADSDIEDWLITTSASAINDEVRRHVSSRTATHAQARFDGNLAGAPSCPQCRAVDAPAYNPGLWNVPNIQPYNNCYNYANNNATNTFAQPGRASGHPATAMACSNVASAAQSDGLKPVKNFSSPLAAGSGWYVALVVWPQNDYHWYRQDNVGCWSHKPGQTAARNVDNAGAAISDPQTCNRGPYTDFCSYMVTSRSVHIR